MYQKPKPQQELLEEVRKSNEDWALDHQTSVGVLQPPRLFFAKAGLRESQNRMHHMHREAFKTEPHTNAGKRLGLLFLALPHSQ